VKGTFSICSSCSASVRNTTISWKQKVHYRVCKHPPLALILNRKNQVHSLRSLFFELHFIIILSSTPGFLSSHVLQKHWIYLFSLHGCYVSRPSHPPLFDHLNYSLRRVEKWKNSDIWNPLLVMDCCLCRCWLLKSPRQPHKCACNTDAVLYQTLRKGLLWEGEFVRIQTGCFFCIYILCHWIGYRMQNHHAPVYISGIN
jgi:hypothetical protein